MSLIRWGNLLGRGIPNLQNFACGKWAEHSFDITTFTRHKGETKDCREDWSDAGYEIVEHMHVYWKAWARLRSNIEDLPTPLPERFRLVAPQYRVFIDQVRLPLAASLQVPPNVALYIRTRQDFRDRDLLRHLIVSCIPKKPFVQSRLSDTQAVTENPVLSDVFSTLELHPTSDRCHKEKKLDLTLLGLPTEIHLLVLSSLLDDDMADIISLCLTNTQFWSFAAEFLDKYYKSFFGQLAGKNIVFLNGLVNPPVYPPGLFRPEDAGMLTKDNAGSWDAYPFPSETQFSNLDIIEKLQRRGILPNCGTDPDKYLLITRGAYQLYWRCRYPQSEPREGKWFPLHEQWILRNLTIKEIVRAEAIALSPTDIRGPYIRLNGFGEVVSRRTRWATTLTGNTQHDRWLRGPWAGHRFDVVTLERHETETETETETHKEDWSDVSDEVAQEMRDFWRFELGDDWHHILERQWRNIFGQEHTFYCPEWRR
ncbi:hypothetical protein F5Y16DRAFT_423216 [Xylariaceae sp. FL0255]|nr:hypothetical protein F5Y16DRAFT_423216 [Xylariaceae sp. FL0255]